MQQIAATLVILFCLSWMLAAGAGQTPGEQFQVNTYTTGLQIDAAVAIDGDGNVIVVWADIPHPNDPVLSASILGQRYNSLGTAIGGEFQVDTAATGVFQANPSVIAGAGGEFAVVWQSYGPDGSDASSYSVQGRVFDTAGNPVGGQFLINTFTTGTQRAPRVASDGGQFLVVWESEASGGTDGSSFSIQGQRFDSTGTLQGGEFQANTYTTGSQDNPAVTASADPDQFLVVWESSNAPGDASGESVQGQLFDSLGLPLAAQFQVNAITTSSQNRPQAAANPAGDFLVVWDGSASGGDDGDQLSVQGRLVDSDGIPLSGDFQVNTYTTDRQYRPAVASDGDGNFVVVWESGGSGGTDTNSYSIQGRRLDATAAPLGNEFQVNTYTSDSQRRAAVAMAANGDFTVAWQSLGSGGSDDSSYSIQARRLSALSLTISTRGVFNDEDMDGFADPGETITYSLTVANASNLPLAFFGAATLTNVSVTDTAASPVVCPSGNPIPALAAGADEVCTGTYTLTQADVDAGQKDDVATADSDQTDAVEAEGSVPLPQNPGLELIKNGTFTDDNGNGEAEVGETIAYDFTVTNTGNVTLTGVAVTDPIVAAISCPSGEPIPSLAPASSEVCTGTYTVTQADLDLGCRRNTATVTGDDPSAGQVMDSGTDSVVLNPLFADGFETGDVSAWSAAVGGP